MTSKVEVYVHWDEKVKAYRMDHLDVVCHTRVEHKMTTPSDWVSSKVNRNIFKLTFEDAWRRECKKQIDKMQFDWTAFDDSEKYHF